MARRLTAVAVVLLVVLAGCQGLSGGDATTTPGDTTAGDAATTDAPTTTDASTTTEADAAAPEDPEEDVIGWEGGYWYNESIDVDRSDGLNDSELAAVVNRSMARVERIRGLEFERTVPVEVMSREEFAEETEAAYANVSRNDRIHQNAKFEATFMLGENQSAMEQLQTNRQVAVGGYYSPTEDRIAIVSENTTAPKMDEITLSQELFHALQDQQFAISEYNQSTRELHNAKDGIVEGDGNYVDHLYSERCTAEWDCLMPEQQAGGGGSSERHIGIAIINLQPYSDGPAFVEQLRESGGWEAVNDAYEQPPESTEQTIHPDKYGEDSPTDVTVADTSTDEWSVPDMGEGSVDYAQFGEAGLYATLYYPSYVESVEAQAPREVIIPYSQFFAPSQNPDTVDMYDYDYNYTAGWDGDKLVPYATENSHETNETAYVWKTAWDSAAEAEEFADGYTHLLEYHGASPVDGESDVYRIPEGESEFADAFRVVVDGDRVTIVNAPTVDDLDDVHDPAN